MTTQTDLDTINASYPHIGKMLSEKWGTKDLVSYIEQLLQDTRDGSRRGFPFQVMAALVNIQSLHLQSAGAPPDRKDIKDTWARHSHL
ncbi:MAG: hypothetical protein RIS48_738 [Pseudomonadota bacterium]|jgi:hypothetical protein|uniref:hypothetical protein n=1 Tax=Malikia spinosa TaxID=86180 RepID=UPI00322DA011